LDLHECAGRENLVKISILSLLPQFMNKYIGKRYLFVLDTCTLFAVLIPYCVLYFCAVAEKLMNKEGRYYE
jgi:hypothetical protein